MSEKSIENVISKVLKGDSQKKAMEFVSYLKANEVPIGKSENYWEIKYNNECVCYVWISGTEELPGPWTIWSAQVPGTWAVWDDVDYIDFPIDERTKQVAWANVNVCGNCGDTNCLNPGGKRKTVLGREFNNLCSSTMAFTNPNTEALNCAKKMITVRIDDILKNAKRSNE